MLNVVAKQQPYMGHYPKQNKTKMFQVQEPKPSREVVPLNIQGREDLAPINPIRTETVLSRFPIHQLSKTSRTNIRILHRQPNGGRISLRWEVSYNDHYGPPRQLAFKLDKLIVDRHLDQLPKPLPRYVRLGSLHKIAQELGLGGDTNKVKRAFLQNSTAYITAKLSYKTQQGNDEHIEEHFSRYNLRFWRQKLDDGTSADAVYLRLNDPFFDILNTTARRPLDYDYLKLLTPVAQRFYELISYQMFAALKFSHSSARLRYSEFCAQAPQSRSLNPKHAQSQMAKVHRPHLKSDYISNLHWQRTTDEQGRPDWFIHYTPGPKAFAEYQAFTGKPAKTPRPRITSALTQQPDRGATSEPSVDKELLSKMTDRGVSQTFAVKVLSDTPPEQLEHIADSLDYFDTIPGQKGTGLLVDLIRRKIEFAANFVTRAQRRQHEAKHQAQLKRHQDRQHLETLHTHYKIRTTRQWVDENISQEDFAQKLEKTKATLNPKYTKMSPEQLRDLATRAAYGAFEHRVPLMSLDAFAKDQEAQQKAQESLEAPSETPTTRDSRSTPQGG